MTGSAKQSRSHKEELDCFVAEPPMIWMASVFFLPGRPDPSKASP
jgi:hypothetical protein